MKYFICSDLHTEFMTPFEYKILFEKLPNVDGIIIAGDLTTKKYLNDVIKELCNKYKHVIYVTGNHEYYGSSFEEISNILKDLSSKFSNFHYLNESVSVEIDGTNFIGNTLWFADDGLNQMYERLLMDFSFIKDFRKHVYELNAYAKHTIGEKVNQDSVVITHHLPTFSSVSSQYKNSSLNRFFVCNMEHIIKYKELRLWIHGHTHDFFDYHQYSTRIICNPLGYSSERTGFKYDLIIDL